MLYSFVSIYVLCALELGDIKFLIRETYNFELDSLLDLDFLLI
jgi:hypothetical protein